MVHQQQTLSVSVNNNTYSCTKTKPMNDCMFMHIYSALKGGGHSYGSH